MIHYWHTQYDQWWVKIVTEQPYCIYYFGPFDSATEAQLNQVDYLQDLLQEGAKGITVNVEQGHPKQLTIAAD